MRELDRDPHDTSAARLPAPAGGPPHGPSAGPHRIGVVGRGRLGTALAAALRAAGYEVEGPLGRGSRPVADAVVLCVPDAEIAAAAEAAGGAAALIGHTSGASPLGVLSAARQAGAEVFGLHPLQTFAHATAAEAAARFAGCGCAIGGSSPAAARAAESIALRLGMRPFELRDEHRPAYHAAASIASNFLVALQAAAERVAGGARMTPEEARRLLAPLVRTTVDNWAALGPERALTGPVARGDWGTVEAQRAVIRESAPELLDLFDALLERSVDLAAAAASPERPTEMASAGATT